MEDTVQSIIMWKKYLTKFNTLHDKNAHTHTHKLEIKMNFLILIKNIYEKLTANITLNNERLKDFSLKVKNKKRMSALTISIQHCTETSSQKKWERKRNKRHPN